MSISRAIIKAALPLMLCTTVATFGCRGDDGGDNTDTDGGGDNGDGDVDPGEDIAIQDLQSDAVADGTAVTLRGVVVVAIDTYGTNRKGNIYVMEPEGGEYSGVLVYLPGTQAAGFAVGDLVDIEGGVKDEFALSEDTSGRTMTEISAPEGGAITITKVGDGTVPAPTVVDPVTFATDDAEAEKWEGVLITFENVSVVSAPFGDSDDASMDVTGPVEISAEMVELSPEAISEGDCYASITGVVNYFFNYSLQPTAAADLQTGGTCLPPEDTEALCQDEMDNDADGFTDCADFSCQSLAICTSEATVVEVQDGTIAEGTHVQIAGAVVTAIDADREHLWVQDATGAADYNGVYVYRGDMPDPLDAAITVGSVVDIDGTIDEFFGLTEIKAIPGGAELITASGDTGTPAVLEQVALADAASTAEAGEPYEGVLVTIENVTVSEVTDAAVGRYTLSDGTTTLLLSGDVFAVTNLQMGDCLTSVAGVVHQVGIGDPPVSTRTINPRAESDVVVDDTGNACN